MRTAIIIGASLVSNAINPSLMNSNIGMSLSFGLCFAFLIWDIYAEATGQR